MKYSYKRLLNLMAFIAMFFAFCTTAKAQVSGFVYCDYNSNGVRDSVDQTTPVKRYYYDAAMNGVQVKAYNAAGVQVGPTKTIDTTGKYYGYFAFTAAEIPPGTPVRIEFTNIRQFYNHSFTATNGQNANKSNVQFVTAPATEVNFASVNPWDYWNQNTDPNPVLALINGHRGTRNGHNSGRASLVFLDNDMDNGNAVPPNNAQILIDTGQTTPARRAGVHAQTGTMFGLAYQNKVGRLIGSAVAKRGYGIGPQGYGGLYFYDKDVVTDRYPKFRGGITLQGINPSNGGAPLDFGIINRDSANDKTAAPAALRALNNYLSNGDRFRTYYGPPANWDERSRDNDAFAKVGKIGWGNIIADKLSNKVYAINLNQRRLVVMNFDTLSTSFLLAATPAQLAPYIQAYDLPSLPNMPAVVGAGNVMRYYGLTANRGIIYLSMVSDASATQRRADLKGYVVRLLASNIPAGAFGTPLVIDFEKYGRIYGSQRVQMNPWTDTWAQAKQKWADSTTSSSIEPRYFPQPMISGLEVNEDISVDIIIRDRWGDQGCNFELTPVNNSVDSVQTFCFGDVLHGFLNADGTWTLEDPARVPATNLIATTTGTVASGTNAFGNGSSYGNTGREFFADRAGDGTPENSAGGVAKLFGTFKHVRTSVDPYPSGTNVDGQAPGNVAQNFWATHGLTWFNTTNGSADKWVRSRGFDQTDKSAALGDIEFLTKPQPIQIGNRVWVDKNKNGVQDADETGPLGLPPGTQMILRGYGLDGIRNTADDRFYSTNLNADGTYYFDNIYETDPRVPLVQRDLLANQIVPGYNYSVELVIPKSTGYDITVQNVSANSRDIVDSDFFKNEDATNIYAIVEINTIYSDHNVDLGLVYTASLGDKVWLDDDKDGLQDSNEPGVAGVTVTLYQNGADGVEGTNDDIVVSSTKTDAYGNYKFDNLEPSTNEATKYNVGFIAPTNYQFTPQSNTQSGTGAGTITGGSQPALEGSDANATSGRTGGFYLNRGQNEVGVDAGLIYKTPTALSSIGDFVWLDNGPTVGTQDPGEPGVSNVTVTLLKETTPGSGIYTVYLSTVTDAAGKYIFNDLPNANYKVQVTPPAGSVLTIYSGSTPANNSLNSDIDPVTNQSGVIPITAGGTVITGIDAGLLTQDPNLCAIGDRTWYDLNKDGIQDPGEPGIAGVTVTLYTGTPGNETVAGTRVTDANGNYLFANLAPGAYRVQFGAVAGMTRTAQNTNGTSATGDALDSDADPVTGRTMGYGLVAGERNMSVDAGYYSSTPNLGALGDKVWNDLDSDGIQDTNEPGVSGVLVTLYNSIGAVVKTTYTDKNGNYLFTDLTPGDYSVGFSNLPPNYTFTKQDVGGDDATDSDANPSTGRTANVNVAANQVVRTLDAGIRGEQPSGKGSLGDRVWYDLNNNGVQDAGELGVGNAIVELFNDANNDGILTGAELTAVATQRTNALGEYLFTDLNKGNYQVAFSSLPSGFTLSTKSTTLNGGTDINDSDGNPLGDAVNNNTATPGKSYTNLIPLAQGEDKLTVDLGIVPPANTNTLGNFVWFDINNDGLQTAGEKGVPGVTVTLYNSGGTAIAVTTTDENGNYLFVGLPDGNYSVGFSNLPAGFNFTTPDHSSASTTGSDAVVSTGKTQTVTLDATNRNERSLDAGIITTRAALGDKVWMDYNADGLQDSNEPGVAGVTTVLYRPGFGLDGIAGNADDALPVASCITDKNGNYFYGNLVPGDYQVEFSTIPNGTTFTKQNTPGDNANNTNSDAVPPTASAITARTGTISLSAGEVDLTIDAGLVTQRPARIGNYVWADAANLGVQDPGELGIAGVLVTLYNSLNQPIGTTYTDGNGYWEMTNVPTGTDYYVIFTPNLPSFNTTAAPGTNPAFTIGSADGAGILSNGAESDTDSDVNQSGPTAGRTGTFNIIPGDNFPNIDAGIINWRNANIVPIQLISFTATERVDGKVQLDWSTALEQNIAKYEVEFSTDGLRYATIGETTTNTNKKYVLLHSQAQKGATNYYRLKIIDANGTVTYSVVRTVKLGAAISVSIYPNPATNILNIKYNKTGIQQLNINIYDEQGRLVKTEQRNNPGSLITIDTKMLTNGFYVVELKTNTETERKQITIINK
jgi:hypothetical protein